MIGESLDDVLCMLLCIAQSGVPSVLYTLLEQLMLDLLRPEVIGDTISVEIANYLDI